MKKVAMAFDFAVILLFVAIGRHSHEHGITFKGIVSTLWPFGVGLIIGWIYLGLTHRNFLAHKSGFYLVLLVVTVGMFLRVISGQGIALSFVLVASLLLTLLLVGWRIIFNRMSN
jgi:hypothetical protein